MPSGGSNYIDVTGQQFGRLTVVKDLGIFIKDGTTKKNHYFLCRCSCENKTEIIVSLGHLRSGHTKSCGCLHEEHNKHGNPKHNLCYNRLYSIYYAMRKRCYKPSQPSYKNYGARGINVCELWLNDFMEFYNWAMQNGYRDGLSLDRIDVDKDYCPENCKWSTMNEQANNKTTTIYLTYKGETKTLTQWANKLGVNYRALYRRYNNGWDIDRIFEQPFRKSPNKK